MNYKVMRMICMFDLPVDTKSEQREYRKFRNYIMSEGFVMIQYSVYVRVCPNREYAQSLSKRIQKNVPKQGNIRLLSVTEKQYSEMKLLVGKNSTKEKIGMERLIVL